MKSKVLALAIFLAATSVAAAQSIDDASLKDRLSTGIQVGAHRGGALSGRGNTMTQFKQAVIDGAGIVETDLRVTKDGVVVVYHDERLEKATNCRGKVSDFKFSELSNCRFKTNSEIIPTFEELLRWSVKNVVIAPEFKTPDAIRPAIDLVQKYKAVEWVYFQTQELKSNYEKVRTLAPDVNLIYYALRKADVRWALTLGDPRLIAIELNPRLHNQKIVREVQAAGKLASANSFQVSPDEERSGVASCDILFELGFDIAITDQVKDCTRQRDIRSGASSSMQSF
ncbi:MAG TPA: glycerophosphodiester phosphodiesterase family protein [Bdellovibrionales bacterium]|nr:glycerophosphodiester phosphodiesterase family protein [Bdellovibrionales bacterium]